MYKFLSGFLGIALLVLGGFYLYKDWSHKKEVTALSNALAKSEGMLKEAENAYSVKAQELKDLETINKDLQDIIEKRDEEVAALGQAVLNWKNKYFKIKDAKETPVGEDGTTIVEVPADCKECLKDLRFRVEFDETMDYLRVYGHTLTNPAYAEVGLSWTRGLKLNFTLTKTKENKYRLYLDTDNSDVVPATLDLKVDPSVFEREWYEKLGVVSAVNLLGSGFSLHLGAIYELGQFAVGPGITFLHLGDKSGYAWGVNGIWYPFRR